MYLWRNLDPKALAAVLESLWRGRPAPLRPVPPTTATGPKPPAGR